jgi:hypothetical protein
MVTKLLYDPKFSHIMEQVAAELIKYLFDKSIEFGVVCDTNGISFEPELPKDIARNIKQMSLFVISGYSFESAYLSDDGILYFEAGFGSQNFGSLVGIPLDRIAQIVIEDTPVFINISAGQKKKVAPKEPSRDSESKSMERLLGNPENKKFLKK